MGGKWPRNVILTKISVACDHGWGVSAALTAFSS